MRRKLLKKINKVKKLKGSFCKIKYRQNDETCTLYGMVLGVLGTSLRIKSKSYTYNLPINSIIDVIERTPMLNDQRYPRK